MKKVPKLRQKFVNFNALKKTLEKVMEEMDI